MALKLKNNAIVYGKIKTKKYTPSDFNLDTLTEILNYEPEVNRVIKKNGSQQSW